MNVNLHRWRDRLEHEFSTLPVTASFGDFASDIGVLLTSIDGPWCTHGDHDDQAWEDRYQLAQQFWGFSHEWFGDILEDFCYLLDRDDEQPLLDALEAGFTGLLPLAPHFYDAESAW